MCDNLIFFVFLSMHQTTYLSLTVFVTICYVCLSMYRCIYLSLFHSLTCSLSLSRLLSVCVSLSLARVWSLSSLSPSLSLSLSLSFSRSLNCFFIIGTASKAMGCVCMIICYVYLCTYLSFCFRIYLSHTI